MPDWTGQTLFGKWKVERLIGVGGTSSVLQARHRNGRRAALKVLHPHLAAHGRTRERFLREGRLANLVSHPGVVAALDDFMTDDGTAVLVLELVQGQTLAALAKESNGVLHPREVVAAAIAVLDILAVAHDAGVIHRDIKPENILRCADGTHKLADFGLAALGHELGMLTGTNVALGTPAYMSPEQARGDALQVDARTDIFGLGATMFTLLTGRYVHASSVPKNLVVAAATEKVPPILSIEPAMHPPLAAVIERSLQMAKDERWPNARSMRAELESIDVPSTTTMRPPRESTLEGATMSTLPSSVLSWSRAGTWLQRSDGRLRRRLVGIAFGGACAAITVPYVWGRLRDAPAAVDRAPTEAAPRAPVPSARAATSSPPAPPLAAPDGVPAAATHVSASSKRSVDTSSGTRRTRNAPASTSVTIPTPALRDGDLSVPDEVLDRRK